MTEEDNDHGRARTALALTVASTSTDLTMTLKTLQHALHVDLAFTLWQASRISGCSEERLLQLADLKELPTAVCELGRTRHSRLEPVTFMCRDARVAAYGGDLLRQLAGTAALRQLCGATWSEWTVRAHQGGVQIAPGMWAAVPIPDAVWTRWHDGHPDQWWIEYDAGSHTRDVLSQRMRTYAHPAHRGDVPRPQLWGAATRERTEFLLDVARAALPASAVCVVRTVDWSDPYTHRGSVGRRLRIRNREVTS